MCVCVLQIARKQARETKQVSEIEREGKVRARVCVCVCVSEQPETDSVLPALAQLMKNE